MDTMHTPSSNHINRSTFSWMRASALLVLGSSAAAARVPLEAHAVRDDKPGSRPKADAEPAREDLERAAKSDRPEKRRVALAKLAALDDAPAWELVLRALRDPEPEVADEAELALPRFRDVRLLQQLAGEKGLRSRDAWVRLRVAEALGRYAQPVDVDWILPAIDPGESELARTLVWSMERLFDAHQLSGDQHKAVALCERLVASRADGCLRGAALCLLEKLDHFAADKHVADALADPDPALRCAALAVHARATEQECLDVSRRMLADPEERVRAAAVENLERLASRASALALVEALQKEPRARLRWQILGWMRAQSGQDHGFDAEAWRAWAATVEGRVHTGEPRASGPLGDTHVAFAGLNLISDRVVFLIDLSGSLWQTKVGERTRKEIVDAELRKALLALPPQTRFNVIPYTGEPQPWERHLVPATKENVARAIAAFERCHQSGRGNFFDAARLALADPEVDALCVLTDGVPTGGHRWNLELMTELLVEQNRFRRVAFDSVLVDAPRSRARQWAALAERTGGRSVAAAPPGP